MWVVVFRWFLVFAEFVIYCESDVLVEVNIDSVHVILFGK